MICGSPEDLVDRVHGPTRQPCLLEPLHPVARRLTACDVRQDGHQIVTVGEAIGVRPEARIVGQSWHAGELAQPPELVVVVRAEDYVAVAGGEDLVRHRVGMGRAPALWHTARQQIVESDVVEPAHLHVQQRDVDVLADTRPVPVS